MKKTCSAFSLEATFYHAAGLLTGLLVFSVLPACPAQTLVNPSFEADTFNNFPGYIGGGNGFVTGWGGPANFGVNPAGGENPFANNGVIPDGRQVAFIQSNGSVTQSVAGFVVGAQYQVRYWENARQSTTPALQVTVGGTGQPTQIISPVHFVTDGDYEQVTCSPFVALSPNMVLSFVKSSPLAGDHTLLIDDVDLQQISMPATPAGAETGPGKLLVYDGFDYPEWGELQTVTPGGFGWAGGYTQEKYDATLYPNLGPLVEPGGMTYGSLWTTGNKVSMDDRRAQRYIDLGAIPAELKSESPTNGTVIRATGKSIWLSALAQQVVAELPSFFGVSLFRDNTEVLFLGKAGGTPPVSLVWKVEGKFPNTTGLSTNLASEPSLLVVRLDWNHDGSLVETYTTNLSTSVITTNRTPVHPDRAYLWVNPDPDLPSLTPETANASAVGVRNATQRGDFLYSFNRVGFRGGALASGLIDELRIGTTYHSVAPTFRNQLDLRTFRSGGDTVIQWRTTPGVVLKSTGNLAGAPVWTLVPGTPQISGEHSFITIPTPTGTAFYALFENP